MERQGSKRVLGLALMASGVVMFVLGVLFWYGVIGIAPDTRPFLSGALGLAGLVDLGVGLRFLQSAGTE